MIARFSITTILASWLVNVTCATLVYQMRDLDDGNLLTATLGEECVYHDRSNSKMSDCISNDPVLQPYIDAGSHGIFMVISDGNPNHLCYTQTVICEAMETNFDYDDDCTEVFGNCSSALRHLHEMMFNKPPSKKM